MSCPRGAASTTGKALTSIRSGFPGPSFLTFRVSIKTSQLSSTSSLLQVRRASGWEAFLTWMAGGPVQLPGTGPLGPACSVCCHAFSGEAGLSSHGRCGQRRSQVWSLLTREQLRGHLIQETRTSVHLVGSHHSAEGRVCGEAFCLTSRCFHFSRGIMFS